MKRIKVEITKAELTGFRVDIENGHPDVSASINLYTENGVKVSSFSVSTNEYMAGPNFDLPIDMIQPIVDIGKQLEAIVTRQCNTALKLLPERKSG